MFFFYCCGKKKLNEIIQNEPFSKKKFNRTEIINCEGERGWYLELLFMFIIMQIVSFIFQCRCCLFNGKNVYLVCFGRFASHLKGIFLFKLDWEIRWMLCGKDSLLRLQHSPSHINNRIFFLGLAKCDTEFKLKAKLDFSFPNKIPQSNGYIFKIIDAWAFQSTQVFKKRVMKLLNTYGRASPKYIGNRIFHPSFHSKLKRAIHVMKHSKCLLVQIRTFWFHFMLITKLRLEIHRTRVRKLHSYLSVVEWDLMKGKTFANINRWWNRKLGRRLQTHFIPKGAFLFNYTLFSSKLVVRSNNLSIKYRV